MTIHTVPGYPSTLRLFRPPDSRYWHCRLFINGKHLKKTTKQELRKEAEKFAKAWWLEIYLKIKQDLSIEEAPLFSKVADLVFQESRSKVEREERSESILTNENYVYTNGVKEHFGLMSVAEIKYRHIDDYVKKLSSRDLSSASIKIHLSFIRKVLKQAMKIDVLTHLPLFPTVSLKQKVRGWFSPEEYKRLLDAVKEISNGNGAKYDDLRRVRYTVIDQELEYFILFMVATFMRPSDAKLLQHKHIEVVEGKSTYLRINTPFSKTVNTPIISLPNGVDIYKDILERQFELGYGFDDDHVFLPEYGRDRNFALEVLRRQFGRVLKHAGLKASASGENRTIYSLRHTAIMFRLMSGDQIDLLTLARNARTSVEMIDRFYAKHLTAEIKIANH